MFHSPLDLVLAAAILLFASVGLLFAIVAIARLRGGRFAAAAVEGGLAGVFLAGAAAALLVGLNFYTYQRLTAEQSLARISFLRRGPQRYTAVLAVPGRADQSFSLRGDEWELDARVLTWKTPALLVGLETRYRLERLSGRYRDVDQARTAARTVYRLSPRQRLDMWPLVLQANRLLPWMDAYYGSAAYLPMADGAAYRISLSRTGLVARPANGPARHAVEAWH